ncbi:hypothetical protein HPP92_011016 [Vanilla planifolia]|uniref:Uncharacterized protein n=1 Tax=Vanilla planifolia TaxID=51239 RepID=A0A835V0C2_VANPL|nr:hypothetical protein HPP92_011016 [Vanilla planifolia]
MTLLKLVENGIHGQGLKLLLLVVIYSVKFLFCRLLLLQQRILDDLSSSLYNLLQVFKNETILNFGEKNSVKQYWGTLLHDNEALTVASMLQLEAGIMEYQYGRIDSSRLHLRVAAEASGTDILVTGVLGYRTVHQVDAKPQLVLVTKTGQQVNGIRRPKAPPEVQNADLGILDSKREFGELDMDAIQRVNDVKRPARLSQSQSDELLSQNKMRFQFDGDYECDILMAPRFVQDAESATDKGEFAIVGKDVVLTAIQQAIILAQCLHLQRSKRDDELSGWEMAPYIEAIDLQCQSNYIIRCSTDILRIRWESTRSRTKQRALLMMDKLVEAVYKSFPTANQRTQLCFAVYSPTIPAMRKEYGELCLGCGMVGEALKIFDDLELWDNLIYCYRCSLGDVTNKDDYYEKALEVSNNKSARAMRSLARSAYNRGDYGASKSLWESAMAVNSLYPDGWFALGAAALKARDIDRAVDGFTRAVQLDPENGEAWNNIACLHMINKKSKPAFIAFKEALKFSKTYNAIGYILVSAFAYRKLVVIEPRSPSIEAIQNAKRWYAKRGVYMKNYYHSTKNNVSLLTLSPCRFKLSGKNNINGKVGTGMLESHQNFKCISTSSGAASILNANVCWPGSKYEHC